MRDFPAPEVPLPGTSAVNPACLRTRAPFRSSSALFSRTLSYFLTELITHSSAGARHNNQYSALESLLKKVKAENDGKHFICLWLPLHACRSGDWRWRFLKCVFSLLTNYERHIPPQGSKLKHSKTLLLLLQQTLLILVILVCYLVPVRQSLNTPSYVNGFIAVSWVPHPAPRTLWHIKV